MDFTDSSVYTSDSDSDDTAQHVLRDFRRRPGYVPIGQQRYIRLERRVQRHLLVSVFDEQSLNLDTLFGDTAGGVQNYDADERARIRLERYRRRRFYAFEFFLPDAYPYNIDTLVNDWTEDRRVGIPQGDYNVRPFGQRLAPAQQLAADLGDHLVGAVGGEPEGSDWDDVAAPIAAPPHRRSPLAWCLQGARSEIKRCLLLYILDIRRANPNVSPNTAWSLLADRLRQEGAVTRAVDLEVLWWAAFGEPDGELFQQIFESSTQEVIALWYDL